MPPVQEKISVDTRGKKETAKGCKEEQHFPPGESLTHYFPGEMSVYGPTVA